MITRYFGNLTFDNAEQNDSICGRQRLVVLLFSIKMDDQTFDQQIALDWIATIEGEKAQIRESDIYPKIRSWTDRTSPRKILDIGCGQGVCSDKFNLNGRDYVGVDPSLFLLERAKQRYSHKNRQFCSGNAYALPFSDGTFDAAFSVAVWHLLSNLNNAATELSRVLIEGGSFLIITANPANYSAWTTPYTETKLEGRRFEGKVTNSDGFESNDILFLHSYEELLDSFNTAHLKVEETETFRSLISIQGKKNLSLKA